MIITFESVRCHDDGSSVTYIGQRYAQCIASLPDIMPSNLYGENKTLACMQNTHILHIHTLLKTVSRALPLLNV